MASGNINPYAVLGVKNTATQAEIQAAYKKKARSLHPDVNKAPNAEDQFKELGEAYEILRDEQKRSRYDRYGDPNAKPPPPGGGFGGQGFGGGFPGGGRRPPRGGRPRSPFEDLGFEDIRVGADDLGGGLNFESIFRRQQRRQAEQESPREREVHLTIPLAHAFTGTTLNMSVDLPTPSGGKETRTVRLKIPQGAKDADRLKLKDPAVTVVLKVETNDNFELDGRDVKMTLDVSPWEAALGGPIEVPFISGTLKLRIPEGTNTGQKLRLRGKGLPQKPGRDGDPGDLYVKIRIVVPNKLSDEERKLFEELSRTSTFKPRN